MEKFSQYRDRGTQIAPFLPIHGSRSAIQTAYCFLLFLLRVPFFVSIACSYFLVFHWLPVGSFVRKAWLWSVLGICGVWWVDLQVEGVKRGSLAKQSSKLPRPGSVMVSSYTSPLDAIYLAAIFDPVFTVTYPSTELVQHVPLPVFLLRTFLTPTLHPPKSAKLVPLSSLLANYPTRTILLFPEATPTNGRGILRFTPALATTPAKTPIFPISLKYTPADITTPLPHSYWQFVYSLLSRPTHCIRVRIAETIYNEAGEKAAELASGSSSETITEDSADLQSRVCEKGAEALARIGRVKRLNLGVKEKIGFVEAWRKNKR